MLVSDYVIEVDPLSGLCSVCISERPGGKYWILGTAFMRNFYIIQDMKNARQGIVPLALT